MSAVDDQTKDWRGTLRDLIADEQSELSRQLLARRIVEDELDRIARQTRREP